MIERYKITLFLKSGILDNAGKATNKALNSMGFSNVLDVRIGKYIELKCDKNDIDRIIKSLYNEVMEDYKVEVVK